MKKVIVSHSMLATSTICKTKAVAQTNNWTMGQVKEDAPMEAGSAAHLAWEQWLLGQPPQVVQQTFRDAYKPFSDAYVLSDDRLHLSNLERVFEAFCATCVLSAQPFRVVVQKGQVQSEHQMFASINGYVGQHRLPEHNVQMSDKSDGIVENVDNGSLYSLEWKSTGEWLGEDTMNKYLLDDQISAHTYVCRENGYDVKGVLMFIVQFSKLPVPSKDKCRDHKIPKSDCWPAHLRFQRFFIDRSPEQLEQWKREAEVEAYKYADELIRFEAAGRDFARARTPMEGLFNGSCAKCRLRDFCLRDRRGTDMLITRQPTDTTIVRSGVYDA